MTAVDEIQAAIDKLTDLRSLSRDETWHCFEGAEWFDLIAIESGRSVARVGSGFDFELIATLHAAVDPQLAILNHAYGQLKDGYSPDEPGATEDALDLARAINGATHAPR